MAGLFLADNPTEHGLGRVPFHDPRDGQHLMRASLAADPQAMELARGTQKTWTVPFILDQGQTPKCTAFTGRQWINTTPMATIKSGPSTDTIYAEAQARDGIPGPHDGSNGHGVLKYFQEIGIAGEYLWAGSIMDIVNWVLARGSVWVGSVWHQQMFYPDARHFVHLGGPVVGGHEYLIHKVSVTERVFRCPNSWGENWQGSDRGFFNITWDDLDLLLSDWGDAVGCVQVKAPR